jgi:signal transduction histidine kinase
MPANRTTDLSIIARIWRLAILGCVMLAILGAMLVWSLERSREGNIAVQHTQRVLRALGDYTGEIIRAETGQRGFLLTGQPQYLAPYNAVLATNQAQFQALGALITDPAERQKLARIGTIMSDKLQELGLTIQLAQAGKWDDALSMVKEGRGIRDTEQFQSLSAQIADSEAGALTAREAQDDAESKAVLFALMIGGILAVLVMAIAAARTAAQIGRPLGMLLTGIDALGAGRLDQRVQISSHDEIGRVAKAFNQMADHLVAAMAAQTKGEAALAGANESLQTEIEDRTAAQAGLARSIVELRRSNEELDNFAYGASHDLKAPLRGIRNLTTWITKDVEETASEDTKENLMMLHSRVERLDLLLDSLLQYSRIGRTGGTPEDFDPGKLVNEIIEYMAPRTGFTVTCGQMPRMHTNKAPLEQVLRNLIGNGLKHHDRDTGAVSVTARDLGALVEFRVADDGPGIAPLFHERIFQMFQTLRSRDEMEGSGMGLTIVKKSVEAHGGTIHVESTPPQRGTTFVFTWEKNTPAA